MSLSLAWKAFIRTLRDKTFAKDLAAWMERPAPVMPKPSAAPRRTAAIELLATLQREGRLVDFLQESIDAYSDAQIGAAVRDIHRDCRQTLDRLFGLQPLRQETEGQPITLPAERDPGAWKLTGRTDATAQQGTLRHHGWTLTRHDLPAWTGSDDAAWIVAPAEVEIT